MPNSSITCISRSTTASLALERALCGEPGLSEELSGSEYVMSPDSASCSTRAGSGVCGGGSTGPVSSLPPAAAGATAGVTAVGASAEESPESIGSANRSIP